MKLSSIRLPDAPENNPSPRLPDTTLFRTTLPTPEITIPVPLPRPAALESVPIELSSMMLFPVSAEIPEPKPTMASPLIVLPAELPWSHNASQKRSGPLRQLDLVIAIDDHQGRERSRGEELLR
jgi:hypothetical protein